MTPAEKQDLAVKAARIRMGIIESTHAAKAGHPGGSLGSADLLAYLYFKELHIDPKNPQDPDRDRFVLSKGHCAPGLYSALALRGFFPWEDLKTLRQIGSHLQGHPNMNLTPGVDMSTGSLGQGVSAAAGMALAAKHLHKDFRVYTLLGDGEIEEGQVWEALMLAANYKLDNLVVIIDKNGLQIDGPTKEVMDSGDINAKLQAFGFATAEINGHDFDELETAFNQARQTKGQPFGIVMHTVKGTGVSYMLNSVEWHGKAPNDAEYEVAMRELGAKLAELEGE